MKKAEIIKLFEMLKAAYPAMFAKKARDEKEIEEFINLYYQTFSNEEFETVQKALSLKIINSKFPPTISELVEQVQIQKELEAFQENYAPDDDESAMSKEDIEAFENALIAFSKA